MKIIKLNAIPSTNDYLKEYVKVNDYSNYTVIQTNFQSKGKGQMSNMWHSKKDKNLLCSVLVDNIDLPLVNYFHLHIQVSLAVFSVLSEKIPFVKIKWPNDIMSRKKKIAGILIENSVKNSVIKQSIIGIGLNVNQLNFPENLPNATSMKKVSLKDFNIDLLLREIVARIKINFQNLKQTDTSIYCTNLYQFKIPSMFVDKENKPFLGIISGISKDGKLLVTLIDEKIKEYGFKEIKFL